MALDTGAKVLALNVIEAASPNKDLRHRRSELNALIANHKEDRWLVAPPASLPLPHQISPNTQHKGTH